MFTLHNDGITHNDCSVCIKSGTDKQNPLANEVQYDHSIH